MRKMIGLAQNKVDLHNLGSDDLLSRLPDEILVSILSSLPLKDATVTSLLSRRWRYLRCQTDSLVFEDSERWSLIDNGESDKYISWVNDIIHQHKSPTIDKFKICFRLDENAKGAISEWIEFAISKNVRTLELNFLRFDGIWGNYCFPDEIFDRKCGSSLKQHSFNVPVMEIKFLKSLILKCVDVNDEGLKRILSNCPVLEYLSIFGSPKLVKAEIHGKSLVLKNLDMIYCELESVEICDSNIVSFSCTSLPVSLRFDNLQKLEKICIITKGRKINDMFRQISCGVPYLKVLALDFDVYRLPGTIELFPLIPKLPQLKQLTIRVVKWGNDDLLALSSLVEACPNLERLEIMKMRLKPGKIREVRQMAKKPHQRLEVVEIGGYHGGTSDLALALYFIQNCVALKKLVIRPKKEGNGGRYNARQQLEPRIPNGVELVIL